MIEKIYVALINEFVFFNTNLYQKKVRTKSLKIFGINF